MDNDDYAWLDSGGPEWELSVEHYKCAECGHVGPAYLKVSQEMQGEGCMTGLVTFATGDMRCTECEHDVLDEIESSPSLEERSNG